MLGADVVTSGISVVCPSALKKKTILLINHAKLNFTTHQRRNELQVVDVIKTTFQKVLLP